MLAQIFNQIQDWLGLGRDLSDVNAFQMALRTVAVYVLTLVIVRVGSKRFLSKATAFDVIVAIMLGSIMSRAATGSAPFLQTILVGAVLVATHWLLARLAYLSDWFGPLVKGKPILLIKDGEVQRSGMREAGLSDADLTQALRMQNDHTDPADIKQAYLERNGNISVIPMKREPRVVEVDVKDGVQTVRIELGG